MQRRIGNPVPVFLAERRAKRMAVNHHANEGQTRRSHIELTGPFLGREAERLKKGARAKQPAPFFIQLPALPLGIAA